MGENGEFCKVCGKWCGMKWVYATWKNERVIVCHDCKRAIEMKNK